MRPKSINRALPWRKAKKHFSTRSSAGRASWRDAAHRAGGGTAGDSRTGAADCRHSILCLGRRLPGGLYQFDPGGAADRFSSQRNAEIAFGADREGDWRHLRGNVRDLDGVLPRLYPCRRSVRRREISPPGGMPGDAPQLDFPLLAGDPRRAVVGGSPRDRPGFRANAFPRAALRPGGLSRFSAVDRVGADIFLIIMRLSGSALFGMQVPLAANGEPSHPAVGWLIEGNWTVRMQVLFLAVIGAPIMEEIVFRGLLYRHLREATRRWGRSASVIVSALITSFVFAVIHPQGPLLVPVLMSIALAFTFAREWRGTLIGSMTAHRAAQWHTDDNAVILAGVAPVRLPAGPLRCKIQVPTEPYRTRAV